MPIKRVVVVFDDRQRPETTGVYCLSALRTLVDVCHVCPGEWDKAASFDADLYLNIDDGYQYRLPEAWRPAAWWVIDTHLSLEFDIQKSADFDVVCAAQRNGAESIRHAGHPRTSWLPLACDPAIHRRHKVGNKFNVCFVGNLVAGPRMSLVELLRQRFARVFVGRCYFEEMAKTYSASHIVFNRSILDDVNMRVFEALACGSMLITNDLSENGQAEMFSDGIHLATYSSPEELADKVDFYLRQPTLRRKIARAGMAEVHAKHSYLERMKTLLTECERFLEATKSNSASPRAKRPPPRIRDRTYYRFDRPEVSALVPENAKRILEIGCAAGQLGAAIKARQKARIVGIEIDEEASALAKQRLDRVYKADIEALPVDWNEGPFDAVICADVLEHLRDPKAVLEKVRRWMAPSGCLIASIPNVRHHSVISGLLAGNWTYETAGLLDNTHLRFFTRREAEKLLYRAGFQIELISYVPGADHSAWIDDGKKGEVRVGGLHVGGLPPQEAEEFYVYQFLLKAIVDSPPDNGLTSIVIVTHNGLDDTRACIESVRLFTDEPIEVIVVDNASTDSTPYYLDALSGVTVIRNQENRGFPAAANQGIAAANGQQAVLLNNDTIVTTGWLRRLLAALNSAPDVGLVGPRSNRVNGRQRVEASYDLKGLDGFAWDFAKAFDRQTEETETLSGFCLAIRRSVFEAVGVLDEAFGLGCLEDDDLCLRARRAGFKCVIARDAFVHHAGHRSFALAGLDQDALYQRNLVYFRRKWSAATPETGLGDVGLTSIIILCHNHVALTRRCVESVRRCTEVPYEFLLVDNGSSDGTQAYLASVPNATVITNQENRGFPAAVNQALAAAKGRQFVLLNNDTVVTSGWLGRLLRVMESRPTVGLVGPCSNAVSGEQRIDVSYGPELDGLEQFAELWARAHSGLTEETDRLVGFCLLISGRLVEEIGLLDEQFGLGCYEDDDYCRRAIKAGWKLVIARESFVHHEGGATFRSIGGDFGELLRVNRELFERKWASQVPIIHQDSDDGVCYPGFNLREGRDGSLLLERSPIVLSLCMIARDNAPTIRPAIESIRPWVDEMIVVDTGSNDGTPDLCERLGAHVSHFPWVDDFSAARNASLDQARGKWVFWMDSDDTIDEKCGRELRQLALSVHEPDMMGYVVRVHCPGPASADGSDVTIVDHVKLVRCHPRIRFEGRIHEQILPAIRRLGGQVGWTELFVTHSGYDHGQEAQQRKLERDLRILELELRDRPGHTFTLFNLGMTLLDAGRFREAAQHLEGSIAAAKPDESHLRKAYALLVSAHERSGDLVAAWRACADGLARFPLDDELRFRHGILLQNSGRLREATQVYRDLLSRSEPRHFTSVVQGIAGYKARHNLALAYEAMGQLAKAEDEWRAILAEVPGYGPAIAALDGMAVTSNP